MNVLFLELIANDINKIFALGMTLFQWEGKLYLRIVIFFLDHMILDYLPYMSICRLIWSMYGTSCIFT